MFVHVSLAAQQYLYRHHINFLDRHLIIPCLSLFRAAYDPLLLLAEHSLLLIF